MRTDSRLNELDRGMLTVDRLSEPEEEPLPLGEVEADTECDKKSKSGSKERLKGLSRHVVVEDPADVSGIF